METSEFSRADEDEPITKTLEEDEDRWRRDFKPPEQYCELTASEEQPWKQQGQKTPPYVSPSDQKAPMERETTKTKIEN